MKHKIVIALLGAVVALGALSLTGCVPTRTQQSAGEYIDDATLTTKVKAALLGDPMVKVLHISVETFRSRVQLSGFVNSQAEIDQAVALTRSVKGVASVDNALRVKTR
jgi:hyperosmotically inducible protein